jgi:hypothetical protein
MIFSVIDEYNEQQLVNVLHVARVSCTKGTTRACIHLANGQWIRTIHSIEQISAQIDSVFRRTCEWLRFMGLQQYEVDNDGINRSEQVRIESLTLPFDSAAAAEAAVQDHADRQTLESGGWRS